MLSNSPHLIIKPKSSKDYSPTDRTGAYGVGAGSTKYMTAGPKDSVCVLVQTHATRLVLHWSLRSGRRSLWKVVVSFAESLCQRLHLLVVLTQEFSEGIVQHQPHCRSVSELLFVIRYHEIIVQRLQRLSEDGDPVPQSGAGA